MKNAKKLNLNDLKIESFVTSLEDKNSQTVKGGSSLPCAEVTLTVVFIAASTAVIAAAVADKFVLSGDNTKKVYRREPGLFDPI